MEYLALCQALYKGLYLVLVHVIFTTTLEMDTSGAIILHMTNSVTYPKSWGWQEENKGYGPRSG